MTRGSLRIRDTMGSPFPSSAFDLFITRTVPVNDGGYGDPALGWGLADYGTFYWEGFGVVGGGATDFAVSSGDASIHPRVGALSGRPSYIASGSAHFFDAAFDDPPFQWGSALIAFSVTSPLAFPVISSGSDIYATRLRINLNHSEGGDNIVFFPEVGLVEITGNSTFLWTPDGTDLGRPMGDGEKWWLRYELDQAAHLIHVRYWADGNTEPLGWHDVDLDPGDDPALVWPNFAFVQEQPAAQGSFIDRGTTLHVHEVHLFNADGSEIVRP